MRIFLLFLIGYRGDTFKDPSLKKQNDSADPPLYDSAASNDCYKAIIQKLRCQKHKQTVSATH